MSDIDFSSPLAPYLKPEPEVSLCGGITVAPIDLANPYTKANADYFDNPDWAQGYFLACHRDAAFKDRWQRAVGSWDGLVVADIGCGPGNLFASLGGKPKALIGVDVSWVSLGMAEKLGYVPLQADAHDLPLASECADLVALNATLHHCDDMEKVLGEAARLVRPGGTLVCDHDPQLTAWDWRGLGMLLYRIRMPLYRLFQGHASEEQRHRMRSETHHRPGHGVTPALFKSVLRPLGFEVQLYPHNNTIGREVLNRVMGKSKFKYRAGQILSGIDPRSPDAALSLMCVATRRHQAAA